MRKGFSDFCPLEQQRISGNLNISAGTHATGSAIIEPISYGQGWKIGLAGEICKTFLYPVGATSVIRGPEYAEQVLAAYNLK